MGTETRPHLVKALDKDDATVKFNNPLMGTETAFL